MPCGSPRGIFLILNFEWGILNLRGEILAKAAIFSYYSYLSYLSYHGYFRRVERIFCG